MEDGQQFKQNMWYECVRDSSFGHIVRFATGGRMFKFLDEKNPDIWKKVVSEEKSANMAHHGTTEQQEDGSEKGDEKDDASARPDWNRESSEDTQVGDDAQRNQVSGAKVDPEKGKDVHLIDFLPNDPEVCSPRYGWLRRANLVAEPS